MHLLSKASFTWMVLCLHREAGRRLWEDDILYAAVSSPWWMDVLHWGYDFNSFPETWIKWGHKQIYFPVKRFTSWRQLRANVTYCAWFIFAFGPANCCAAFQALKLSLCLLKEALQTHWLWVQYGFLAHWLIVNFQLRNWKIHKPNSVLRHVCSSLLKTLKEQTVEFLSCHHTCSSSSLSFNKTYTTGCLVHTEKRHREH